MPSSNSVILKNSGIHSHNNLLSAAPSGSAIESLNTVIDRNEVLEPRRGFGQYGSVYGTPGVDSAKQLLTYKDLVLRHVDNKLQFDSDLNGDFRDLVNTYSIPIEEIETGLRIKFQEVNGNLYITTKEGIKKLSARNRLDLLNETLTNSGGIKGLDVNLTLNFTDIGFLEPNSKVAYRITYGYYDLNENLILGSPSAPAQIYNSTTNSCYVDLNFTLPSGLTSKYFYQINRTAISNETDPMIEPGDPGDEMNLVFQENITDADILAGFISVADKTPEDFRKSGTLLYTNPTSGEGIAQANEPPPFARDITTYKGYTFYANTSTVQRLNFSLLTIEGLVSNTDTFTITDNDGITTVYTFQGAIETFTADYTGSVIGDYYNLVSGPAKYFTVATANIDRKYYVWYYQSPNDIDPELSGFVGIKVTILNTDTTAIVRSKTVTAILDATDDFNVTSPGNTVVMAASNNGYITVVPSGVTPFVPTETINNFTISADGLGRGEDVSNKKIFLPRVPGISENGPTVSQQIEQASKSLVRVINSQDPLVAAYYQSTYLSVPGQMLLEGREIVGPVIYLLSSEGTNFTPSLPSSLPSANSVFSTNEVRPNRVMYSKFQQPEAVPLANYIDVGPKDRSIKRIIALRDSLFILKEDGIYRLSGEAAPFTVTPFDFSVQVLSPDTAVILNNQIYALSTQGVIVITDTGVSVISRPIENKLLAVTKTGFDYKTISFGVGYESDRAYHLWLPTIATDTYGTQCYRYNTFTNTWTRWDKTANCGLVNFGDDKMYLGPGDLNFIEKERKSLTRTDQADRQYDKAIILDTVVLDKIEVDDIVNFEKGDVIIQKQTVTIDQFNRLLRKLDDDSFITDKTYVSGLELFAGNSIRNKLEDLATKLDNDLVVDLTTYSALVGIYTNTITSIVKNLNNTTINISGTNSFKVGRYVKFNLTDTLPRLNSGKNYKVLSITPTSITIDTVLDVVFSNPGLASVQTDELSFEDVQGCYNLISGQLNVDTGLNFTNYPTSTGYVEIEQIVRAVNKPQRVITVPNFKKLLFGDIILYKAIKSKVIYNPQFFGDVAMDKQVREGTAIFENDNFSTFMVGYSSDKFPAFVDKEFARPGNGDFGQFGWDGNNWGGVAAPTPLRTYVPRDKMRCRFLNVKLEHKVAFEKYSLFGFSLNFRPYNIRTNK